MCHIYGLQVRIQRFRTRSVIIATSTVSMPTIEYGMANFLAMFTNFLRTDVEYPGLCYATNWKTSIWDFFRVWCTVDKLYHRANQHSSLRPIVCLVVEIQHFVCDRATPPTIEKLWSKGVATVDFRFVWTLCSVSSAIRDLFRTLRSDPSVHFHRQKLVSCLEDK